MKIGLFTAISACVALIATSPLFSILKSGGPDHSPGKGAPTYAQDIAPILNSRCVSCHREGQVAPFSLETYRDAAAHAETMAAAVKTGYMPPWHAAPNFGGPFADARTLTGGQVTLISQWAAAGAPPGDLGSAPKPLHFSTGWQGGTPDLVLQTAAPYSLAAAGPDVYRCFVVPTNLTQDRFLRAVEVRPGNLRIVHHVMGYVDKTGQARKLAAGDPGMGYDHFGGPGFGSPGLLGGWVPGMGSQLLPDGVGMLLPANSDIVLQVHYHRDGKPETDRTQVALYFSTKPVDKVQRMLLITNKFLDIPPGKVGYEAAAQLTLPCNIHLTNILPHMHNTGRVMSITAALPGGKVLPIISIPAWDFNWQTRYCLVHPLALPSGTTIHIVARYDNSSANARNPNVPPREITYGEQSTNEMCLAILWYTADSEHITAGRPAATDAAMDTAMFTGVVTSLVAQFDTRHDGKLNQTELANLIRYILHLSPASSRGALSQANPSQLADLSIKMFDRDGDGKLSVAEILALVTRFGKGGALGMLSQP